jgi:hypothetical protein
MEDVGARKFLRDGKLGPGGRGLAWVLLALPKWM